MVQKSMCTHFIYGDHTFPIDMILKNINVLYIRNEWDIFFFFWVYLKDIENFKKQKNFLEI